MRLKTQRVRLTLDPSMDEDIIRTCELLGVTFESNSRDPDAARIGNHHSQWLPIAAELYVANGDGVASTSLDLLGIAHADKAGVKQLRLRISDFTPRLYKMCRELPGPLRAEALRAILRSVCRDFLQPDIRTLIPRDLRTSATANEDAYKANISSVPFKQAHELPTERIGPYDEMFDEEDPPF